MADKQNDPFLKATVANASVASPDQHSDPANFARYGIETGDADPRDISTILMGAQATNGKAVIAAGRMTVNADSADARRQAQAEQQRRDSQQARELANLAAWNSKTTTVGGVQMTNAQAQEARQRFIDNEDFYAERAVQMGYIKPDEKEELKRGVRRKFELEDKTGRGTISDAERKELRDWDRSSVGQAGDKITAAIHQGNGFALNASESRADITLKSGSAISSLNAGELFQSAPNLGTEFKAATLAASSESKAVPPTPVPISKDVKATGMDL